MLYCTLQIIFHEVSCSNSYCTSYWLWHWNMTSISVSIWIGHTHSLSLCGSEYVLGTRSEHVPGTDINFCSELIPGTKWIVSRCDFDEFLCFEIMSYSDGMALSKFTAKMRLFSLWVSDCSPFTLSHCHCVVVVCWLVMVSRTQFIYGFFILLSIAFRVFLAYYYFSWLMVALSVVSVLLELYILKQTVYVFRKIPNLSAHDLRMLQELSSGFIWAATTLCLCYVRSLDIALCDFSIF